MKRTHSPLVMAGALVLAGLPVQALDILLVTDNAANTRTLQTFLENEGHLVTAEGRRDGPGDAEAYDVVVVSRQTNSGDYATNAAEAKSWNELTVPIVLMSGFLQRYSRWGWITTDAVGGGAASDGFDSPYPDPGHPFVAGLADPTNIIFNSDRNSHRTVLGDLLASGVTVVAESDGGTRAAIFTIDPGTTMATNGGDRGAAGAVRVFWSHNSTDDWGEINANGEQVMRNILAEVSGPPPVDSDADDLPDDWELAQTGVSILSDLDGTILNPVGSGAMSGDFDGDGLADIDEYNGGFQSADAGLPDTDGDTLTDDVETRSGTYNGPTDTGTNPASEDSDGDGYNDNIEDNDGSWNGTGDPGTDPNNPDTDGDGLNDKVESNSGSYTDITDTGTDPHEPDTDFDGVEDLIDGDPHDPNNDDDGDGIGNATESDLVGTDPLDADTDGDCLKDGEEDLNANGVVEANETDPLYEDTDGGGALDGTEVLYGTNPTEGNDADDQAALDQVPDILFIGSAGDASAGADGLAASFMACRYGFEAVTYMQASAAMTSDGATRDLIVLSSTPGSNDMRGKFQDLAVPIVNWEEALSDANTAGEFGLCTAVMAKTGPANTPTTQMDLIDHPITAGLPATIDLFPGTTGETTCTPDLFAGLTAVGTAVDGNVTGGGGNHTVGDPVAGYAMLFIAETGQAVDPAAGVAGNAAPSRRVMFPWTDATANLASDDFMQLFGQALDWALAAPAGGITLANPVYVAGSPDTVTADLSTSGPVDIYRSNTGMNGSWVPTGASDLAAGTAVVIDPNAPALPATALYIAVPAGGTAP